MCVHVCAMQCNIHDKFCSNLSVFCASGKQRERETHLTSAYAIQHLQGGHTCASGRLPKHFEVNKLLIFSTGADDSMASSWGREKRGEERRRKEVNRGEGWSEEQRETEERSSRGLISPRRRACLADGAVSLALRLMPSCIWQAPLKTHAHVLSMGLKNKQGAARGRGAPGISQEFKLL